MLPWPDTEVRYPAEVLALTAVPSLDEASQDRLHLIVQRLQTQASNPFNILFGGGDLADAVRIAQRAGADRLELEVFPAGTELDLMASMGGFGLKRVVLQLRRSLPLPPPWEPYEPIEVRPFKPGTGDEEAWLEVNNRTFAWHPEQGSWTIDDLHARMAEPWFDPDGFLLHERDGRLAGFCWTRIHQEETPAAGEVFVIGLHPDFQGRGLGRPLTYAGFDWLTDKGLTRALLFTEADNHPAVRLYNQMGFNVTTTHRWYERKL